MKVLFVYSDSKCSCTIKCCFELSVAMQKYVDTTIVFYKDLDEEIIKDKDIIIFQRLGANNGLITPEDKTKIFNMIENYKNTKRFIYLIDDLLLEPQGAFPKELTKRCNAALCSSKILSKHLGELNPNVYTFHTFIDCDLFEPIEGTDYKKFTMVWASTGGLGANIIREIIDRKEELGMDFELIAMGGASAEFAGKDYIKTYPIVPNVEMIKIVKGANILLNPMMMSEAVKARIRVNCKASMEDFLNSKSEIKYAIAGITKTCILTSDIDNYKKIIENGVNGYMLSDDPEEWIKAIKYAYEHQEEMKEIAQRAYDHVKLEYDKDAVARQIISILEGIIRNN